MRAHPVHMLRVPSAALAAVILVRDYLRLNVQGADHFRFSVRAIHTQILALHTGHEGERVTGRRIAVYGLVTERPDGGFDMMIMQPTTAIRDNMIFADASLTGVEGFPPGMAGGG